MVTFFSSTLVFSLVGMILVLVLKRFEMRSGRTLFVRLRPFFNRFFHRSLVWVEYVLPDALETTLKRLVYALTRVVRGGVVEVMRFFEHKLEALLEAVRRRTRPPQGGNKEASTFLREVADHKRSVMHRKGDHEIFEE